MFFMVLTCEVFHVPMAWLKAAAFWNVNFIFVTREVSQSPISVLKLPLWSNRKDMSVTCDTSHSGMSTLPAAPQSAPPSEQHFSPEGTAVRQLVTASERAALLVNGGLLQTEVSSIFPSMHFLVPSRTNSPSHVGWHMDPLARSDVQSPTPPLAGGADASQGGG